MEFWVYNEIFSLSLLASYSTSLRSWRNYDKDIKALLKKSHHHNPQNVAHYTKNPYRLNRNVQNDMLQTKTLQRAYWDCNACVLSIRSVYGCRQHGLVKELHHTNTSPHNSRTDDDSQEGQLHQPPTNTHDRDIGWLLHSTQCSSPAGWLAQDCCWVVLETRRRRAGVIVVYSDLQDAHS